MFMSDFGSREMQHLIVRGDVSVSQADCAFKTPRSQRFALTCGKLAALLVSWHARAAGGQADALRNQR